MGMADLPEESGHVQTSDQQSTKVGDAYENWVAESRGRITRPVKQIILSRGPMALAAIRLAIRGTSRRATAQRTPGLPSLRGPHG